MRPHRKPRKPLRTAFAVFTLMLVTAYVGSAWFTVGYLTNGADDMHLSGGLLEYFKHGVRLKAWKDVEAGWYLEGPQHPRFFLGFQWIGPGSHYPYFLHISAPLWPLVALLILTNVFWYRLDWRNRLRPGFCTKCGYDLRATSNRCPECGHESEPAPS